MPGVTIFRNPGKPGKKRKAKAPRAMRRNPPGEIITERVLDIRYKHSEDGKWYKHTFKPGICAALMADGTVVLFQKNGKPVAQNF